MGAPRRSGPRRLRAIRDRRPSAPTTRPSRQHAPVVGPVPKGHARDTPTGVGHGPGDRHSGLHGGTGLLGRLQQDRIQDVAAGREDEVEPALDLELALDASVWKHEGGRSDGWRAAGQHVLEQAPSVELHDATTGQGMGRQGVAGEVGSIDEGNVEALAGEQHRRRGARHSGADDDDVVRVMGVVAFHGATIRHRRLVTLGEVVESRWRSRPGSRPRRRRASSVDRMTATFDLPGTGTVNRLGFGAMRITGEGIWGPPATTTRRSPCCAGPSTSASTSSTPPTATALCVARS